MTSNASPEQWLQDRSPAWQNIEQGLPELEDGKPVSYDTLRQAIHTYPELARDVAIARREAPGSRMAAYLEAVYARLHRALFRAPRSSREDLGKLFSTDIPAISYGLRWQIFSVLAGFVLAGSAGWWLVWEYPELATLFASEAMIEKVQQGELWTDGLLNILPSSILSLQILTNNIMVALTAMCLGVFYGLGTIYIIGLNGLMLGGVFAMTARYGMADELFEFVVAHGCVELSVIIVAGAVGFSVGESLARPGELSRSVAFRESVQRGTKLMLVCVLFLVGAGVIEGNISPNDSFPLMVRVVVGIAYWLLFVVVLCGWRLPRPDAARPTAARPNAAQPIAARPIAARPNAAQPIAARPNAARP